VDEDGYIYVEKVEPENTSGFVFLLRKGIRFPLHAGAAGKILLAYQPEEKIEGFLKANKFEKYTEKTVLDPAELRKQLKAIRKAGYAFSEEEISLGVRAFAAPIFNHEGKIIAGLTVFGPIQRITGPKKETILKLILEYSQKISEEIGGTAAKKAAR
jgi:DNA-binding IclR family transcriptional regulator